jgi:hypothetical protein
MSLLDPRFNYIPAAETDIAATWKRFGFDPRANAERRARLRRRIADVAAPAHSETPPIRMLVKLRA